jgi:hypothetical protein
MSIIYLIIIIYKTKIRDLCYTVVMESYSQMKSPQTLPQEFEVFTQSFRQGENLSFHFGKFPFAVSAICRQIETGFIVELFVSGRETNIEGAAIGHVMRMTTAIPEKTLIEGAIQHLWETQLEDIAYSSAVAGGIGIADFPMVVTRSDRDELLMFHLSAQSRFRDLARDPKLNRVEETAWQHNLIRSFGVKQTASLLAEAELKRDMANKFETKEELEIETLEKKIFAVNQRLRKARKLGLLSSFVEVQGSNRNVTGTSRT